MSERTFTNEDYTVGWICPLSLELTAAMAMLDEEHRPLPRAPGDTNSYQLGHIRHEHIGQHNIVLAALPSGGIGNNSAAMVATNLLRSYPNIRFGLLVGIGGGAPSNSPNIDPKKDIRLGDVVVSNPEGEHGGVIQYDFGKTVREGTFVHTGTLNKPPTTLRTAAAQIRARHRMRQNRIQHFIDAVIKEHPMLAEEGYNDPGLGSDQLFQVNYDHQSRGVDCNQCEAGQLVDRKPRMKRDPVIHYGVIGSANQVMKHGITRERLRKESGILCFEMEAAGLMDDFPCIVIRGVCDYSDSHKNKRWQPYAAATAAAYAKELLQLIPAADVEVSSKALEVMNELVLEVKAGFEGVRAEIETSKQAEERLRMLTWLAPVNYGDQHSNIISKRCKGTGQWLIESPQFQDWVSQKGGVLYCPGGPGAGKTMLASIVVDHIQRSQLGDNIGAAYVYCNFWQQQEPIDILSNILKQLFATRTHIATEMRDMYEEHKFKGIRPSFDEVIKSLHSISTSCSRVFIIMDALDEYGASNEWRQKVLTALFDLQRLTSANLFLTSRFEPDIGRHFEKLITLEIRASDNDLGTFVETSYLPSFVSANQNLMHEVKNKIVTAVDGVFLLAHLHLNSLTDLMTVNELKEKLIALAQGSDAYDSAYEEAMARILSQKSGFARWAVKLISWITHAKRPLTTAEMREALAIKIGQPRISDDDKPNINDVVSKCAGLVIVDERGKTVRLVHHTTQEYFQRTRKKWFPNGQADISRRCITYLSLDAFNVECCSSHVQFTRRLMSYKLYHYAATTLSDHVCQAGLDGIPIEREQSIRELFGYEPKFSAIGQALEVPLRMKMPFETFREGRPPYIYQEGCLQGIHMASYLGLSGVVAVMLADGQDPNTLTPSKYTPLAFAVQACHQVSVQLLLEKGADPDVNISCWGTPLLKAAQFGRQDIARMLLDHGASINVRDIDGQTALLKALEFGSKKVDELTSNKGAKCDLKENCGLAPIAHGVLDKLLDMVELLLNKGATVDIRDRFGKTPLCLALKAHQTAQERLPIVNCLKLTAIFKLLLNQSANPNRRRKDEPSLLMNALSGRSETLTILLLDKGASLDGHDMDRQTPLHLAASHGYDTIVGLLLDRGADFDVQNAYGQTPLHAAASSGHRTIVELFIDKGADIHGQDTYGQTPLHIAAYYGYDMAVKLLLKKGADANIQDDEKQTPLIVSIEKGHIGIVRQLLDKNDEISIQDVYGKTAGEMAEEIADKNIRRTIVKLLEDKRAGLDM